MSAHTRSSLLICLLLIIISLVVFWRVLNNEFVAYDDPQYIINNQHVQGLTIENIKWALTATRASNWHPLTWMSHMLDCQIYGAEKAKGHHATNLLFHIANSLLLFLLLTRMTGSVWRSGFVAALFAIHPLHVESVAWVAERKDVLSTLFWLLTMWAYVRYTEQPGIKRYLPVVLLFALGLMSKPMLVTLPLVLLMMDFWPLGRLQTAVRSLIWEKIPLFAISAASCIVTYMVQQTALSSPNVQLGMRVANAFVSYISYIGKMMWPCKLAILYPFPGNTIPEWKVAGSALLLVCMTVLAIRARNRRPYFTIGWFWYLITLIPVIGLIQVGLQAMADRYTYVPLIGLFIAIAWGIPDIAAFPRLPAVALAKAGLRLPAYPTLPILAGSVIMILTVCAWRQVGYWHDSFALFQHAAKVTINNFVAQTNMGDLLVAQGKIDEAMKCYNEAVRIYPGSVEIRLVFGKALYKQQKYDKAIAQYSEAVRIKPESLEAQTLLGNALLGQGVVDKAVDHLSKAVRISPDSWQTHYNLANALGRKGSYKEAITHYSRSLKINPYNVNARNNLGLALITQGRSDEAIAQYLKAVQINPNLVEAYINLGSVLIDQGKADEAAEYLRKALEIKPDYAKAHHNLAAALYFKGKYARAWEEIRLCREYGLNPNPNLIELLSQKMPEPQD